MALAGCGRPDAAARPIEVLVATPPQTLDPRFVTDAVGMRVTRLAHAGLVRLDPATLAPVPAAASSLTLVDERTLDVTLRDDVRFASGAPFESADVCATIDALRDPALASPHRVLVQDVASCEVRSPRELTLRLRTPRATLLTDLELPMLRRDQARSAPDARGGLDGLGAFAVTAVEDDAVHLAARTGGVDPRPAHDVEVRVVRDENARALRLLAGRADVLPNGVSPPLLDALVKDGAAVTTRPGANLTYLLIHDQRAPFTDASTRRGLASAIDRATIARTLLGGRAEPADGLLPRSSFAFSPFDPPIAFDPDLARRALEPARGQPLQLLTSTDRARITVARAIAQMLGDAGLAVDVLPLDLGVLLARLSQGDYELAILQIPELTEPNLLRWFFHSSSIPKPGGAGANRARYASPEVDAWLDRAATTTDLAERRALYARIQAKMAADMPIVPLFREDQVAVTSARAASFVLSAEGRWGALARLP